MKIMPIRSATESTLWKMSSQQLEDRMRNLLMVETQLRIKRVNSFGAESMKLSLRIEKAVIERRRTENVLIEKKRRLREKPKRKT